MRCGELSAIDAANIAEEIESLGRSDRRELESRLTVLVMHLLKWSKQPERPLPPLPRLRGRGGVGAWSATIREQRRQIEKLLRESPSLRPFVEDALGRAYADGREDAVEETGLDESDFPAECPFGLDEVLSRTFLLGPN